MSHQTSNLDPVTVNYDQCCLQTHFLKYGKFKSLYESKQWNPSPALPNLFGKNKLRATKRIVGAQGKYKWWHGLWVPLTLGAQGKLPQLPPHPCWWHWISCSYLLRINFIFYRSPNVSNKLKDKFLFYSHIITSLYYTYSPLVFRKTYRFRRV